MAYKHRKAEFGSKHSEQAKTQAMYRAGCTLQYTDGSSLTVTHRDTQAWEKAEEE